VIPTGQVGYTSAGDLAAKWVIHAVGPIYNQGQHGEHEDLKAAVRNSLLLADSLGCKSISLPAISSGIYGYPKDLCA
jgi:putative ATPase